MTPSEYVKMVGFHSAGHIYMVLPGAHQIWCTPDIGMKYIQGGWFSIVCGVIK